MAISAVVAVGSAADPLVERLAHKARHLTVGPGVDASSDVGPVITAEARDCITGYITRGERAGATLLVDGRNCEVDGHPHGFFVGPTLFDDVTTGMEIYTDEIFGPVLVVLRAQSLAEAVDSSMATLMRTAPQFLRPAAMLHVRFRDTFRSG